MVAGVVKVKNSVMLDSSIPEPRCNGFNSNAIKYRSEMYSLQRPPIELLPRAAKCLRPALPLTWSVPKYSYTP